MEGILNQCEKMKIVFTFDWTLKLMVLLRVTWSVQSSIWWLKINCSLKYIVVHRS